MTSFFLLARSHVSNLTNNLNQFMKVIFLITVFTPIFITIATANPSTHKEPLKAMFLPSKTETSDATGSAWYSSGSASPVMEEVSSLNSVHF